MDRLTQEKQIGCFASLVDPAASKPGVFGDYDGFFAHQVAVTRLKVYEDIGTPDELTLLQKACSEGRVLPYGPGDAVWDRFGMMWEVTSSEIHLLDGKRVPLYRCGHPGTDDYCALWEEEALDKEAGAKAWAAWAEEIAAIQRNHQAVEP